MTPPKTIYIDSIERLNNGESKITYRSFDELEDEVEEAPLRPLVRFTEIPSPHGHHQGFHAPKTR